MRLWLQWIGVLRNNVHTLIIIYTHNKKIIGEEHDKSHPPFSMREQL